MTLDVGRYGIFTTGALTTAESAREVEAAGFGTLWIGGNRSAELALPEELLDATEHLVVGTSILNMWLAPARETAESFHRIEKRHPGRFLLGVGIGHPESVQEYRSPLDTIVAYLDELDAAGVPAAARGLAALGPKVTRVAGERTAGALPYLTTPEHTRGAREILGTGPLLAPEQKVVLSTDPEYARGIGRPRVSTPYLGLTNYRRNLLRSGFTEEDLDTASDALVDALVLHGTPEAVATGLTAHLDAGADHVAAHVLSASRELDEEWRAGVRALAGTLGLG